MRASSEYCKFLTEVFIDEREQRKNWEQDVGHKRSHDSSESCCKSNSKILVIAKGDANIMEAQPRVGVTMLMDWMR